MVLSSLLQSRVRFPCSHRPPGPKGLPFLGNLVAFGKDELGFITETARRYGDLVWLNLAGWPALLVSDMEAIETILVKDYGNYIKHRFALRHVKALFGNGLLTNEGESWRRQRRLAAPAFAGQQLLAYDAAIVSLTHQMLDRWTNDQVLNIHPEMMELTLRIAAKTLFDSEAEWDIADIDHAANDLVIEMESRFKRPILIPDAVPLPGHFRYRRAIRTLERIVSSIIAERRASGLEGRYDVLSRLMEARDEMGKPMSDALLRDEAITLLLAGHDTTALALSWTWFLLGQRPEIQARMAAEIADVLGDRPATTDDIPRLKYTESVALESMRIYPPAWIIGRESIGAFKLGGYAFPAGVTIFISPWVLHRDPRHFAQPEMFRPERWMGNLAHELPRFAYMPFGGGPRICIGQRFAMMEAVLILTTMAQRFSAEWQSGHKVTPFPSINLRPRGGVWLKIKDRETGH
ncbi:cytochrome P450 [Mesorhizobium sp. M0815]|uniref:cytochrome P450 n=1 Tax=unclassified Mesorhizobium TaxID=325217 RepID=UPI0033389495